MLPTRRRRSAAGGKCWWQVLGLGYSTWLLGMLPNAKGMRTPRGGWTGRAWGQLIGPSAAVRHMRVRPFPAGSLPPLQESYQASGLQAFEEMQPQYNLLAGGWAGGPSLSRDGSGPPAAAVLCSSK